MMPGQSSARRLIGTDGARRPAKCSLGRFEMILLGRSTPRLAYDRAFPRSAHMMLAHADAVDLEPVPVLLAFALDLGDRNLTVVEQGVSVHVFEDLVVISPHRISLVHPPGCHADRRPA